MTTCAAHRAREASEQCKSVSDASTQFEYRSTTTPMPQVEPDGYLHEYLRHDQYDSSAPHDGPYSHGEAGERGTDWMAARDPTPTKPQPERERIDDFRGALRLHLVECMDVFAGVMPSDPTCLPGPGHVLSVKADMVRELLARALEVIDA